MTPASRGLAFAAVGAFLLVVVALAASQRWPLERSTAPPPTAITLRLPSMADHALHPLIDARELDRPAAAPQRIVGLGRNVTESLAALGLAEAIVGRDSFSSHPPTIRGAVDCGGLLNASVEPIVELEPDLVIADAAFSTLIEQMDRLGIATLTVRSGSRDDVLVAIETIGDAVGRPLTARRLAESLRREVDLVTAELAEALPRGVRVAMLPGRFSPPNAYVATAGDYAGGILASGGAVLPTGESAYVPMDAEALVTFDPQIVIEVTFDADAPSGARRVANPAAWRTLNVAAADGGVVQLNSEAPMVPGPRINLAARDLAAAIAAAYESTATTQPIANAEDDE